MITQDQLRELLFQQWNLYELQRVYGVGDTLRPAMDVVQRQTRALAQPAPEPLPPGDPLARIFAAPSQWAKWLDMSDAEAQALIDGGHITRDQKNFLNNWWRDYGVKGQRWPDGTYHYAIYVNGVEHMLVDTGGADAATEQASGKTIPGPSLP